MGINFVDYDEMERKFRSDLTIDFNNCRFCFQHITDEESQHLLPFEYMERIKDEQINYIK